MAAGKPGKAHSKFTRFFLVFLFFLGITHWLAFFYLAHVPVSDKGAANAAAIPSPLFQSKSFTAHDWHKEIQYHKVIKDALCAKTLPFHVPEMGKLFRVKNRFLGASIWPMSPQIILLCFMSPMTFCVINMLIMYSIGFYGCMLIRARYQLSLPSFSFLFLLFNFNGYFVEKIAAYGPGQLGYFLMPFLFLFMLQAASPENKDSRRQFSLGILMGIILSAILYQGSAHYFVEAVTFVVVWGLVNYKLWRPAAVSLVTAVSTGAVRILPALSAVGLGTNPGFTSWWGYFNPWKFLKALAVTCDHMTAPMFSWWEFSLYIGWAGLLAVLYFGLWSNVKKKEWAGFKGWKSMALPCLIFSVISWWHFKKYIIPNFIPLLNKESVPCRYMIFPLLVAVIAAAVNMEGFTRKFGKKRPVNYLLPAGLIIMAAFLFNHSRIWRMHRVQDEYDWVISEGLPRSLSHISLYIKNDMSDTLYIFSFWLGLAVSLAAIFLVIFFIARNNRTIYNNVIRQAPTNKI